MGAPPDFSKPIPLLDGLRGLAICMVVVARALGSYAADPTWSFAATIKR